MVSSSDRPSEDRNSVHSLGFNLPRQPRRNLPAIFTIAKAPSRPLWRLSLNAQERIQPIAKVQPAAECRLVERGGDNTRVHRSTIPRQQHGDLLHRWNMDIAKADVKVIIDKIS